MMLCIDKITCVRMYLLIEFYWQERIGELERELPAIADEQRRFSVNGRLPGCAKPSWRLW